MATKRKPTRAKALGVSDEQYERLLAAQGGGCAICGNTPKTRRLHVDHDHATGEVRGLICHRDNRFLLHTWATEAILSSAAAYRRLGGFRAGACGAVLDEINATGQDGES